MAGNGGSLRGGEDKRRMVEIVVVSGEVDEVEEREENAYDVFY